MPTPIATGAGKGRETPHAVGSKGPKIFYRVGFPAEVFFGRVVEKV